MVVAQGKEIYRGDHQSDAVRAYNEAPRKGRYKDQAKELLKNILLFSWGFKGTENEAAKLIEVALEEAHRKGAEDG